MRFQYFPKKLRGIILCFLLLHTLVSAAWGTELPRYMGLTILHTNDIHGHLFTLDYYDNDFDGANIHLQDVGGAARQATLIRQLKTTSPYPVLVMSAGDVFTRGPISFLHGTPDFDVMNAVPYDVMTLGNNEFEGGEGAAGQRVLFDRIKQARFPVVSANVFYKSSGKTIVPPYKIFDINGVKIGVLGLTAPRVASYSTAEGLDVSDPIAVAKTIVAELQQKADFIIALTHIGYDSGKKACDLQLAEQVPGIDVIIGGDSHTWLRQPTLVREGKDSDSAFYVGGTIVNQAGESGVAVDRIDLRLRRAEGHRYRVMSYSAKIINVDSTAAPADDVIALLGRYTKSLQNVVGRLSKDVSKAEMGDWLARCLQETAGTQIGMAFKVTIEGGLKAGPVDSLALRRMFPFKKELLKATATGKQLKDFIAAWKTAAWNPFLSGARMLNGELYIGDEKAVETQSYTVAVEDFWGIRRSGAELAPTDLTIWDAITKYLAKGAN